MNDSWLKQWTLRIATITGTQAVSLVLNALVAFVLIRSLSKEEFAWFAIATGMSSVLGTLNDGGISAAVNAHGGTIWKDTHQLSALIRSALSLQNWTTVLSCLLVTPILVWLLWNQSAPTEIILIAVVLTLAPQWMATRSTILSNVNRLRSRVRQIQHAELLTSLARATFTLVPAAMGWVNLTVALVAITLSIIAQSLLVRWQMRPILHAELIPEQALHFRRLIRSTMVRLYPNAAFYCLQAQLAASLLAFLGHSGQVADLGALTRLGFILTLMAAPLGHLFSPAFARCLDPKRLRFLFLGVLGTYLIAQLAFVTTVHIQADHILSLFGPSYHHLPNELVLMALHLCLALTTQIFWALNLARGWHKWVWLNIPLSLAAQITTAFLVDASTVKGAIYITLSTSLPSLSIAIAVATIGLFSLTQRSSLPPKN